MGLFDSLEGRKAYTKNTKMIVNGGFLKIEDPLYAMAFQS